jgi:hypothetical protein
MGDTLELISDSIIVILKWKSYEENTLPFHRATPNERIKEAVTRVDEGLLGLYTKALNLQARIRADTRTIRGFTRELCQIRAWIIC